MVTGPTPRIHSLALSSVLGEHKPNPHLSRPTGSVLRFRVRGLDAAQSPPAEEAAFFRTLPGASWASSEAAVGQNRCTLRQASMPSSTAVQTGVAFRAPRPGAWYN